MRKIPFDKNKLEEIASKWPTPFHIYDAKAIRENAKRLKKAFSWNKGFREYFAVKAAPNPELMKLLKEFDFGSDCSSMAELVLAERVGNIGEAIMFTSNDTPAEEFRKAWELGAIINLDDITHWDFLLDNQVFHCYFYTALLSKRLKRLVEFIHFLYYTELLALKYNA